LPENNTRVVWRPTYVIRHPGNGPRELVYKTTQYIVCKNCKDRFGVNVELHGLSKTRFETYTKKETQNLAQSGGINYKPPYDVTQEFAQTMKGLCPYCLADAADKFLSENNNTAAGNTSSSTSTSLAG
jgi:hypothetical protein